jgi:2-polyprenyl-3-methyl-5-hydroxy-6-metoxy-1,4-benzoquinol methylase
MSEPPICPLSCAEGSKVGQFEALDLVRAYLDYYEVTLPKSIIEKYFHNTIDRFKCPTCDLQWFRGIPSAEADFYEHLQKYEWYYAAETWDKNLTFQVVQQLQSRRVLEIGSGGGQLIKRIAESGICAAGVELNENARKQTRSEGLEVFDANDSMWKTFGADTIVMLQVLEHVERPVSFLQTYSISREVKNIVIAVPCTESLLARSGDPLMWLPHHVTLWSNSSLALLAEKVGFRISEFHLQPLEWPDLNWRATREKKRKLKGLWNWPSGRTGKLLFEIAKTLRLPWTICNHSILVTLERKTER